MPIAHERCQGLLSDRAGRRHAERNCARHARDEFRRKHGEAETKHGAHGLAERTEVDGSIVGIQTRERASGTSFELQLAQVVVFDDQGTCARGPRE